MALVAEMALYAEPIGPLGPRQTEHLAAVMILDNEAELCLPCASSDKMANVDI